MNHLHIDLETYSEVDLKKVGLDVYAKHPSTEIMMTAWALDQGEVWWTEEVPGSLEGWAMEPHTLWYAFNAQFERTLLKEVAGIDVPIEKWRCVMVHAYHLSFNGTLETIGHQLGLPADKKKIADGKRLIQKFCSPAPRNHLVRRYTKENAPEDWARFREYNIQDVVAEREIEMLLARYPMPEPEWNLWFLDQRVNDRGLPIDQELVEAAVEIYHDEKRHLMHTLKRLTGLDNPNSRDQMLGWLRKFGYPKEDLQAETVTEVLKSDWNPGPLPIQVLKLKQQLARTAGAKWEAFENKTDWDTKRLRSAFQMNGASRTGRWGGRGVQPHNLHRSPKDQDEKVRSMLV